MALVGLGIGAVHMLAPNRWVPLTVYCRSRGVRTRRTALIAVFRGLAHTVGSLVVMFVALAVSFAVASNFFSVSATVVGLFFLAVGAWKFASTAREQDRWYEEVGLQRGTKLFVFAAASSSELTIFHVYLASSVFRLAAALITLVSFCAGTIASPATVTLVGVRRMGRSLRAPGKEKQIDYAIPPVLLAPWAPVLAGG